MEVLPAQRRARILDQVREHGAASINELAKELQASLSTIRRDLDQLTEEGYLERTHGGVLLRRTEPTTFEAEAVLNVHKAVKQKRAIGLVAAQRINPGSSLFCDSSSTVEHAMRVLVEANIPLTVATNSLTIAALCASGQTMRVIVPGGTVRAGTVSMFGQPGEHFLQSLHADVCFLGTHSITGTVLTEASLEAVITKKTMIANSRKTILLADSSKFQLPSFCTIANIDQVDEIITDTGVLPEHLAAFDNLNLKVTVVPC